MTISTYLLRQRNLAKDIRVVANAHREFCSTFGKPLAKRRGLDPRVVRMPDSRPDIYADPNEEQEEIDPEKEKIEEMRMAFALPKDAWFASDHTFIQQTEEPGIWRFGITSYMKAYFAYVYAINVTCSVGERLTYVSSPLDIEFEAAGRSTEAVPDTHMFTPPMLISYVQAINWPLVHQPRKIMDDTPQHEWLLELYWDGNPAIEENFVDGYPGPWMDTKTYVDFLMNLDPRDLYSRFPSLRVGDPALTEFSNYDGNTRDRVHKVSWKPDWWPWGM